MLNQLMWLTGIIVLVAMIIAYRASRDPLHPLMFIGPMLLYIYSFQPATLLHTEQLSRYFPEESDLVYVQIVNLIGVLLFCLGCLRSRVTPRDLRSGPARPSLSPVTRQRLRLLSYLFGFVGVFNFFYMLWLRGGFVAAYSNPKGGGVAPSGYVGESPMLTLPAIVFYLMSLRGERLRIPHLAMVLVFASPHLIHGLLGSRRGPLFLILAALLWSWYLVSSRRPSLRTLLTSVAVIGTMVFFVWSHRRQLYLGSDFEFTPSSVLEQFAPSEAGTGDLYIVGSGQIINSRYHGRHFWGHRYAVIFFVRPVPVQLWRTKYVDSGMPEFARGNPNCFDNGEWMQSLHWTPDKGSATGFIADMYLEFSWGFALVSYGLGLVFGFLWKRAVTAKGLWTILYIEASILSLYLPAQSVSAWLYRFLIMAVPTAFVWKMFVGHLWRFSPAPLRARLTSTALPSS